MSSTLVIGALIGAALLVQVVWSLTHRKKSLRAEAVAADVAALGGDLVPASLHPVIDPDLCIGSGSCVVACPEHDVIGMIGGRASLINPLACIGHGACAAACPVDAIDLVFGTEHRGIELPRIDTDFQTNQPGVYIAGELGGMGLIRNAVSQGRQAAEHIIASDRRGGGEVLDAVVVGAGPAGISAMLALHQAGLRAVLLESDVYGGTIRHYPRAKVVMTGKLELPMIGTVNARTMSKEELIELWDRIRAEADFEVVTGERVSELRARADGHWDVVATSGTRAAANVVLALGRRGAPRQLGVPGEDAGHVHYQVIEPEAFAGRRVLVVGGGNAAADAAIALAGTGRTKVMLSYRRFELARMRASVRDEVYAAISDGRIEAHFGTEVDAIGRDAVTLRKGNNGHTTDVRADAVVVQIGGTSPRELLASFGIEMVTKHGEA